MDTQTLRDYLDRIGLDEPPALTPEGLKQTQQAHLRHIPFENLDVIENRLPLKLDADSLAQKIVYSKRGGICYELNWLYADLLRTLGFDVHVFGGIDRRCERAPYKISHLFCVVDFPADGDDASPERWMTDVGFGKNYAAPLRYEMGLKQTDGRNWYRLSEAPEWGEGFVRFDKLHPGEEDELMLVFDESEMQISRYEDKCIEFCTQPDSVFRKGACLCLDTPEARITLSGNHFVITDDATGTRTSKDLEGPEEFERYLLDVFGIVR